MSNWTHKVTTNTGTVYLLDMEEGFFSREPEAAYLEAYPNEISAYTQSIRDRLLSLKSIPPTADGDAYYNTAYDVNLPVVGECMHIVGRDTWWISTPVASVEEVLVEPQSEPPKDDF